MTAQGSEPVSIRADGSRRAEGKIRIEVAVRNAGDRPCFVIANVRRVTMDASTRTLSVWFSAEARSRRTPGRFRTEFTAPKAEAIPEHSDRMLHAELPEDMTRLVAHGDGGFHLEAVDLRPADTLEVHVAVADKPFYVSPGREDHQDQVKRWGRSLTARVPIAARDAPARK